jgi:hypothetical protein
MILTGRARELYLRRAVRRAVLDARLRALSGGRPERLPVPAGDDRDRGTGGRARPERAAGH